MNLPQMLEWLQNNPEFNAGVRRWEIQPAAPARYGGFPEALDPRLIAALQSRGVPDLYSHQTTAVAAALAGRSTVVVTPTASGKTLCYNLPVLHAILREPASRALYLFPTKALAQDQLVELKELSDRLDVEIKPYVYDGDTPDSIRPHIRQAGQVVVTNPDMLHTGILPHHTRWVRLFENLKYVVIDELHTYRGVFGSHLANVLRRLRRICQFYGSRPQFLCSSATIANPQELAEKLTGEPVELVDRNGAPRGEKHIIFYNPPVVTRDGLREPVLKSARRMAGMFLRHDIQTIVFARSRLATEILVTYLKEDLARGAKGVTTKQSERVRGYRGGYLPLQRREIERGLRSGEVLGVVSTNALELGIDVGQLEACVMAGYPGTIASAWQQAGRAGRRQGISVAVLVASSAPLDQYIVEHPDYFFERSPEHGLINPDNLMILVSHLKCAAFELPFSENEAFGVDRGGTQEILDYLQEEKILRHTAGKWHWMNESFPAEEISLRSASSENFVIVDTTHPGHRVLGELDRLAAMTMLHTHAIYLHEGEQFLVDRLAWDENRAYVHRVDVDYYTDASLAVTIRPLDTFRQQEEGLLEKTFGEVMTACMATIFKKVKLYTHENVGWGEIHLPEDEMHTAAYWITIPEPVEREFLPDELQSALLGTAHLVESLASMFLMCDARDLRATAQVRSPQTGRPTIYLYDAYPGGIGLAEKTYDLHRILLETALERALHCVCKDGCPACVGPNTGGRSATVRLLRLALGEAPMGSAAAGRSGGVTESQVAP